MKRKIVIALISALALTMSLPACSTLTTGNNSDLKKIKELVIENKELNAQLEDSNSTGDNQQSASEAESLLQATLASPEIRGVCGANLTWYYQNGVLAITGAGEMTDYKSYHDKNDGYIKADTPWYDLKDKIDWVIIDDGVTTIGKNGFYGLDNLSRVVFPGTLTDIRDSSFNGCNNIKEIALPSSLISIGNFAFYGCKNLMEVIIPNSVTSIGDAALDYNIEKIIFLGDAPENLETFIWANSIQDSGRAWNHEPTNSELLKEKRVYFKNMSIYYTGDTFDEFINSYPYWSDYGVEWIKQ